MLCRSPSTYCQESLPSLNLHLPLQRAGRTGTLIQGYGRQDLASPPPAPPRAKRQRQMGLPDTGLWEWLRSLGGSRRERKAQGEEET